MVDKNVIEQSGNVITGDVDRTRTIPFVNFPAEVVNEKKEGEDRVSVPTGRVVTEEQKHYVQCKVEIFRQSGDIAIQATTSVEIKNY